MLIENVLGLEVHGSDNSILWRVKRSDRHGIDHLQLRDQFVSLIAASHGEILKIDVECKKPFELTIEWKGKAQTLQIKKGKKQIQF